MATERLYREDLRLGRFRAHVIDAEPRAGGTVALVLDRTAFFPGGGGQPPDRGTLNGAPVLGFEERPGGEVVHVVCPGAPAAGRPADGHAAEGFAPGSSIEGEVDIARRLDLARQHTGQHLLSAAALHLFGAETLSVHFGDEDSTLDLDRPPLGGGEIEALEREAERVILEDRPVRAAVHAAGDAARVGLRRPPPADQILAGEGLRIVTIEGYDVSACCGTHVRRTGELGAARIVGQEKARGRARLRFAAGERATRAARAEVRALADAARRAEAARREAERRAEALEARLARALAAEWLAGAGGGAAAVVRALGLDEPRPEMVATHVVESGGSAALARAGEGGAVALVLARPAAAPGGCDLAAAAREAFAPLGGKGGGRPHFVRYGFPAGTAVDAVLAAARRLLASPIRP